MTTKHLLFASAASLAAALAQPSLAQDAAGAEVFEQSCAGATAPPANSPRRA